MSLTVGQAAETLGVTESEVRRLIAAGELVAARFGERMWKVDAQSVIQRRARRPGRGRPWSPVKAWAALWELSGLRVDWLHPVERSRLRAQLRRVDADALEIATRRRADVEKGRVLPEYLPRLRAVEGVVTTGVSAAAEIGADILSADLVDVYCSSQLRSDLIVRFGVDLTSSRPNVLLRTPQPDQLSLLEDRTVMPAAAVAIDLLGSPEPRTARAGRELLTPLLEAARP